MMDPLVDPLADALSRVQLSAPQIPYLSGVTGTWITADQATDARYWARHAREPVQFSPAIKELRKNPEAILLEVGPGNVLATLARQHSGFPANQVVVSSLSDGFSGEGDLEALMAALGILWLAGEKPNWAMLHQGNSRQRVSLPTYPFERKRYWLENIADAAETRVATAPVGAAVSKIVETESQINQGTETVNIASKIQSAPASTTSAANRVVRIQAALVEMFQELSGVDLSATDSATSFLELGFDSLFLTQAAQALQEKFGVKITFRQLLNDVSSLSALTGHVESNLAPEVFADPAVVEAAPEPAQVGVTPADSGPSGVQPARAETGGAATASEGSMERLMREQLQAMNQLFAKQLETFQGAASRPAASATSSAAISTPAPRVAAEAISTGVDAAPPAASKPFGPYKPPQTVCRKS
jgi:acyl transferase domain-containing protein